jgi:uncharacterized protein
VQTRFEWDPSKAASNLRKHGIRFETAALAFADPHALLEQDRVEEGEARWQILGVVDGDLLLMVAHTVREEAEVEIVRIISARNADRKERRRYEEINGAI